MSRRYVEFLPRDKWLETIYPFANDILAVLTEIPWASYRFEGMSETTHYNEKTDKIYSAETGLVVTPDDVPYNVFGGAACEIYNKFYSSGPRLQKYAGPTADLDVRVARLKVVEYTDTSKYDAGVVDTQSSQPFLYITDHYTKLGEDYTMWIIAQLRKALVPLAAYFSKPPFTKMKPEYDKETQAADYIEELGNLLITRAVFVDSDVMKIQVGVGVGTTYSHILEFLFGLETAAPLSEDNAGPQFEIPNSAFPYQVNGKEIFTTPVLQSVRNEVKALKARQGVSKIYNHYARLIYLSNLISYLESIGSPDISVWQTKPRRVAVGGRVFYTAGVVAQPILELKEAYETGLFRDTASCPPPARCDETQIIAPIEYLFTSY